MCCLHMVLFTCVDHHVLPPHGFIYLCGSSCAASTWFYSPVWIIMCCLHMVLFTSVDHPVLPPHGFIYLCGSSCAASTWFYLPVWIIMSCLHMVLFTCVDHHVLPPHGFIYLCGSSCAVSTWFYLPQWIILCCLHMVLFTCVDHHVLPPHGFIYLSGSSCAATTWFYLPVWIIMCCLHMVLFTSVDHHVLPPHGFIYLCGSSCAASTWFCLSSSVRTPDTDIALLSPRRASSCKTKVWRNSSTHRTWPVADLRGARDPHASPPGVQILSISCSFWEISAKLYIGAPPPGELAPPPRGNPGSATDDVKNKVTIFVPFVCRGQTWLVKEKKFFIVAQQKTARIIINFNNIKTLML